MDERRLTVRFEILTAASMNVSVFWVVAPCSLVEVYQLIALMMEAASTSETSVNFHQTAWCNNPEDSRLHGLTVFENRVLSRIFGPKREEVTGGWR
jgi:hypothetical protein